MRIAAQVALAYGAILVTGAVWRLFPMGGLIPNLTALFAIYLGLTAREKMAPSVAGAVIMGYLADLLSGTPAGLMSFTAGLVCALGHVIQERLLVRGPVFTAIFSAITAFVFGLVVIIIRAVSGLVPEGVFAELGLLLQSAVLTGLLGPLVFRACRFMDARFAHTRRDRDAAATGVFS